MQKCYYRSENDYFQVEQFTSRSFMVRSIFHISSWTQHNNVPVPKSMETVQENRSIKTQLAHCSPIILHIFIEGHFHISLQSIIAVSLWFEQIEVPYVPEQENISKSEKSTCNCKKKKTESKQKPFVARVLRIKPWFPCENRATWS